MSEGEFFLHFQFTPQRHKSSAIDDINQNPITNVTSCHDLKTFPNNADDIMKIPVCLVNYFMSSDF